jgi:putative ABC transport system ATP-binding protein
VDIFELRAVELERDGTRVIGPVDLKVGGCATFVIMGPSGSGKTSLLRLLNRLEDPSRGEVVYRGKSLESYDVELLRREVGMVFQRAELFEGTVEENLRFGPAIHGMEADVGELLRIVGLDESMLTRKVGTLSGGQAQRVSIGRSLAVKPQVLLLDEPTTGLDPTATHQVETAVRNLTREMEVTSVFVTHNVEQARRVGDRAVLLIDGRKVEEGSIDEILERPSDTRTALFIRGELE